MNTTQQQSERAESGRHLRARSAAGFSFMEIMVVVGIIGVLLMIAAPAVVRRIPIYKIDSTKWHNLAQFNRARMQAMALGMDVNLVYNLGAKTCRLWADRDRDNTQDAGEWTEWDLTEYPDISFWVYPTTNLRFRPDGTFYSGYYGLMYFRIMQNDRPDYTYIYVYPSGKVYAYDYRYE